ncbi:MAG: ABC transporter permease [Ferruginibacter sp.]|nr:ABC transporter permease [Ferruginibacter sp.]
MEKIITDEHWDEIIEPRSKLFDLRLKEVWRYRDLLILFVKRDFAAQYKQTILGPLWHLIQPVFTTIVFLFVFKSIAGIQTDGINATLFFMSGITIWNYFSACLTGTSNTFVANAGIFGKVYFPRLVIPLSTVLSNIIKFVIQFFVLFLVMVWIGFKEQYFYFGATWLLIPLLVVMMAGMGLGLGIIISSLTTKYRDFTVLIGFAVQLLMYLTPIAYPLSILKGKSYAWLLQYNPLTPIVEAFRYALLGKGSFEPLHLLYSAIFILTTLFFGAVIFNKVERSFMDTV